MGQLAVIPKSLPIQLLDTYNQIETNVHEHILVRDVLKIVMNFLVQLHHCGKHGHHLSTYCLHVDCLNHKREIQDYSGPHYSYQFTNVKQSQIQICSNCSNQLIVFHLNDSNDFDRLYVKEVNQNIYFEMGDPTREYFKISRCLNCDNKENCLYTLSKSAGEYSRKLILDGRDILQTAVSGYDHRWYLSLHVHDYRYW